MGLLQDYNVNIDMIDIINIGIDEICENSGLFKVNYFEIEWKEEKEELNSISTRIFNKLVNTGELNAEDEIEEFLVKELGLSSSDLINFI